MGFGDAKPSLTKVDEDGPISVKRSLTWQVPSYEVQYGKNLAIVGQPMVGKTMLALLFGYYNSEYKKEIIDAGYPAVVEVMEADILPEIRKIMVLETENNLLKALNSGVEKALLKPFVQRRMIQIAPILISRKEAKIVNGKLVSIRREMIEEQKEEFDEAVKAIVADEDEHTLFIIDSMSAYKKLLDDKFGLMYEVISKRDSATMDGIDTYKQAYYASRNTWWENLMQAKRGFKGWNIDTYKESEIPEHWRKPGEDDFRIKWIGGTEHNLDMVYRVEKLPSGDRDIHILNGRYEPSTLEERTFPYLLDSRMGAMPVINSMAEKLLLGEE